LSMMVSFPRSHGFWRFYGEILAATSFPGNGSPLRRVKWRVG
jgi:hypothetical protein